MNKVYVTDSVISNRMILKKLLLLKFYCTLGFSSILIIILLVNVGKPAASMIHDDLGNNAYETENRCTRVNLTPKMYPATQSQALNEPASENMAQIQFEEVSTSVGISYTAPSYGASFGDFNGDNWPDLWVGNHQSHPTLYLNQKDGTFIDITAEAWSSDPNVDTHGAAWGDFDNDGDQDLFELVGAHSGTGEGPNHLFVADNDMLLEQAPALGLDYPLGRGRSPIWFDYNRDGSLDVLLVNGIRSDGQAPSAVFQQTENIFQEASVGLEVSEIENAEFAQLADLSGDGRLDLIISATEYPQRVYDISVVPFEEVTAVIGLPQTRKSRDVIIADFDGNLLSDLYVTRYEEKSDLTQIDDYTVHAFFHINQVEHGVSFQTTGEVSFNLYETVSLRESDIYIGSDGHHPSACCPFTLSPQDPTVIGIQDHVPGADSGAYIGYDPATQVWQLLTSIPDYDVKIKALISSASPISNLTAVGFEPSLPYLPDRLMMHNHNEFVDQTLDAGLGISTGCVSGAAGDFDNDMDVDLYLVCSRQVANLPNILYENQSNGTFIAVPEAGGAVGSSLGRGGDVVVADYDRDGFLDLFVTNGALPKPFPNGPHQLFHNLGNDNHWIEIDLVGVDSNRDGIGARVLIITDGLAQLREQDGGMHRFSQNDQQIHFGLGNNTQVDYLVIRWPSGIVQEFFNIPADQLLHVVESPISTVQHSYLPVIWKTDQ